MRPGEIKRKTAETDISCWLDLDGSGNFSGSCGIPFFEHMLKALTKHGQLDLELTCKGDLEVDDHHSVEDMGICLGKAYRQALGDMRGITRFAHAILPMDEALVLAAVDLSGRPYLAYDVTFKTDRAGDFEACLMEEFLRAFAFAAGITLHIRMLAGSNTHHILECVMKAVARALRTAAAIDPTVEDIPSTKGVL